MVFFAKAFYNRAMSTLVDRLQSAVFQQRPTLSRLFEQHGDLSIQNYIAGWKVSEQPISEIFLQSLRAEAETLYGAATAAAITAQLSTLPLVSTIDHHGILNHPFFLNANLLYSLWPKSARLVVLATAGISLNNSSWPAALTATNQGGQLKHYSFFPDRYKTRTALLAPGITAQDARNFCTKIIHDETLGNAEKQALLQLESSCVQPVLSQGEFVRQASVASSLLWRQLFPQAGEIAYLPLEPVISRMLVLELAVAGSLFSELLFGENALADWHTYFFGLKGAFGSGGYGSFLFWGLDNQGRRVRLQYANDHLVGNDFTVAFERVAILEALEQKKIYPTSLLCFLALLSANVTCLGGFNQINWLTDIREKFASWLLKIHQADLASRVSALPTDNYAEMNLAFLPWGNGLVRASAADIVASGLQQPHARYRALAHELTVGESIQTLLPEMYRIIIPERERQADLASLTDAAIAELNGTTAKIKTILQ